MRPLDHPLLADENIDPDVVTALREQGKDVRTVFEEGLVGSDDVDILRRAHQEGRVVVTHDSDFGTLAIGRGEPYLGIIFLRPGHIRSAVVRNMISAIDLLVIDVRPPFVVVAEQKAHSVRVRVRPKLEIT